MEERNIYYPLFSELTNTLKALPIEKEQVYVCHYEETINFTLYLGKKMMLSIAMPIETGKMEDVMFSISIDKKVILVDKMPVTCLVEKINEVYGKLKD